MLGLQLSQRAAMLLWRSSGLANHNRGTGQPAPLAHKSAATMDTLISDTLADARWFPLRFDVRRDEIHFVWVPAEVQRAVTFLADLKPTDSERRILPRSALDAIPTSEAPLHFILHSGLAGSTLLARVLVQPGVVTTLKEPPILTDVIAFGLKESPERAAKLLQQVTRLLARPFAPAEAVVVKMSSIGNGLVAAMAAGRPMSRLLCLHAPLELMLASLARRGLDGRLGGRKLFIGLRNSGFAELGFTEKQLFELNDLQLAAVAWLAIQRMFLDASVRFGSERVRSISSEQLLGRPADSLSAIAGHFRVDLDVRERLASSVFERHAKTGEPFYAGVRQEQLKISLACHREEIRAIGDWAKKIAEVNSIAWDLPNPLME
jgi:hypothetical protein